MSGTHFEWHCFTLGRLFKIRDVKDTWNGHLVDLIDGNVVLLEVGEPEFYEFRCFLSNPWSTEPRLPIEAGTMDLVKDRKPEAISGTPDQDYSVEENSIQVKYSLHRPLAPNELIKIINGPVEREDANTSVEIYRVLSDSSAAEPDSQKNVSDEGGPEMPPFYARRDNREVKLNWRMLAATNLPRIKFNRSVQLKRKNLSLFEFDI